jgi:hypothetical protein
MKYTLKATGFCPETLTVEVTPSNFKAEDIRVTVSSNAFSTSDSAENIHLVADSNSFAYSKGFRDNGDWDWDYGRWIEEPTAMGMFIYATPETIKETLVNLAKEFNAFHESQDEAAKLTIKAINSLRIEELVPEFSYEVVKTTSRRGTARR